MKQKEEIQVKRFKDWSEASHPEYAATGARAYWDRAENTIYAAKEAPSYVIEHEKYHAAKRHIRNPKNPEDFAQQEIMADLYAYHKTGNPKHILGKLRSLILHLSQVGHYKLQPYRALSIIKETIFETPGVPNSWKEDYLKLDKAVRKIVK